MSIMFYFEKNELYVNAGGYECSVDDYSNQIWNECITELMIFGVQKDTLSKASVNYGVKISELKQYAIPFGQAGIKIIREITRIATKHLTLVMTMSSELSKTKKGSGFVAVEIKK